MSEHYISMLIESQKKKKKVLERIINLNKQQRNLLLDQDTGPDELERNIDQKGAAIEELSMLDNGFQQVFDKVKEELDQNREKYRDDIIELQGLIKEITALGQTIESQELRNKELMVNKFAFVRERVKTVRSTARAISTYNSMNNNSFGEAQLWDNKK